MRHDSEMRRLTILGLLGLTAFASSCDGPNQFRGTPVDPVPPLGDPPVVEVQEPVASPIQEILLGDSVFVRVRVADDVAVDSVTLEGLAFRGDPDLGTDEIVQRFVSKSVPTLGTADTTVTRFLISTGDVNTVEDVFIIARVFDSEGQFAEDTVSVSLVETAPPTVSLEAPDGGTILAVGQEVEVRARITDDLGATQLRISGIAIRGDPGLGTEVLVDRFNGVDLTLDPVTDTTITRVLQATADVTREDVLIIAEVFDADLKLAADTVLVTIGGERPEVTIEAPALSPVQEVLLGDSVLVRARATDDFGLVSLRLSGIALRGDPALGNQEVVTRFAPKTVDVTGATDSTVTRYLLPTLDLTEELVFIVAETTDIDGFVATDTVAVSVLAPEIVPPQVEIQLPRGDSLSALPLGDSAFVQVRAIDDIAVDSVRLFGRSFRGDPDLGTDEIIQRFEPKLIPTAGVTDTIVTRFLNQVQSDVSEQAYIYAEAFDREGNVTVDSVAIFLGGPSVELFGVEDGQSVQAGLGLTFGARAADPNGINRVQLILSGAVDTVFTTTFPEPDTARVNVTLELPEDAVGPLSLTAQARSGLDITGQDGPIEITVIPVDAGDTIRPTAEIAVDRLVRYELTDSIFIDITGQDDTQGSGVAQAGFTARAISIARGDTLYASETRTFSPLTGTVNQRFGFPVFNVDPLALPDEVRYEITGFLIDADGNCAAATGTGDSVACDTTTVPGQTLAENRPGLQVTEIHVAGRTVNLPGGGVIADAVADTSRANLFLSNPDLGRVEVFDLETLEFGASIRAGSRPWGLALTRAEDSLWVANSDATNFSVVDLSTLSNVPPRRFRTPDVTLWDVEVVESDTGPRADADFLPKAGNGFTDEPQFMAVDRFGNLIYSTVVNPTGAAGTARKAFFVPGTEEPEVKLFVEHGFGDLTEGENFWALYNIDFASETFVTVTTTDADGNETETIEARLILRDHVTGFPDSIITGEAELFNGETPTEAAGRLAAQGSDVGFVVAAQWSVDAIGFADTTYVAASGDGDWVAIGEGAIDPAARVLMYQAAQADTTLVSGAIPVSDLLTNASERVRGVAVNYDGSLAMARGDQAYFFSNDLRKQGAAPIPNAAGGSGAVFHPLHSDAERDYYPDTHLAFVGGGDRTIEILDTFRGSRIGAVTIRDTVIGPLKAVLPTAADNVGLQCTSIPVVDEDDNPIGDAVQLYEAGGYDSNPIAPDGITEDACVVVKVYGVTDAGGLVVIPVRKADVLRFQERPGLE